MKKLKLLHILAVSLSSSLISIAVHPVEAFAESVSKVADAPAVKSASPISAQMLRTYPLLSAAVVGKRVVAVGEWGVVMTSTDSGEQWQRQPSPSEETLTALYFADERVGWVAGHHGTILHTKDGGSNWVKQTPDTSAVDPLLGVYFSDLQHGYAVGAFGLLLETKDGGQSWQKRDVGQADMHLKAIGGVEGSIYIASEQGKVIRSLDGGATWQVLETGYRGSFWGVLANKSSVIVYGMRGTVYRSDNQGQTWEKSVTNTTVGLSAGVALSENNIVLAGAEGMVIESQDGGRNFSAFPLSDHSANNTAVALSPSSVLLLGRSVPHIYKLSVP